MYSFNKILLDVYSILDIRDSIVNKRDKETCPIEFTLLLGRTVNKYTGM